MKKFKYVFFVLLSGFFFSNQAAAVDWRDSLSRGVENTRYGFSRTGAYVSKSFGTLRENPDKHYGKALLSAGLSLCSLVGLCKAHNWTDKSLFWWTALGCGAYCFRCLNPVENSDTIPNDQRQRQELKRDTGVRVMHDLTFIIAGSILAYKALPELFNVGKNYMLDTAQQFRSLTPQASYAEPIGKAVLGGIAALGTVAVGTRIGYGFSQEVKDLRQKLKMGL